jgi:hypothetical protein
VSWVRASRRLISWISAASAYSLLTARVHPQHKRPLRPRHRGAYGLTHLIYPIEQTGQTTYSTCPVHSYCLLRC